MPANKTIRATDAAMTSAADMVGGMLRAILRAILLIVDSLREVGRRIGSGTRRCALPGGNYPSNF